MSVRLSHRLSLGLSVLAALALFACGDDSNGDPAPATPADALTGDVDSCEPDCAGKECGDDGCGGTCGTCDGGTTCGGGTCIGDVDPDLLDSDNDGILNGEDNCDFEANFDQADADEDGQGNACDQDMDNDGFLNEDDNCPTVPNQWQHDEDEDGIGSECDADLDNDGYLNDLDCAPENADINPSVTEVCGNGIDDNCDEQIDPEGAEGCTNYYVDGDGDGAGDSDTVRCLCEPDPPHFHITSGDCDDSNPALSPLVPEKCDGIDNNCNLLTDEGCDDDQDDYCDATLEIVGTPDICPLGGGDCYDYSALINPGQEEILNDGMDNDCDGVKAGDEPIYSECPQVCTGQTEEAALCALDICFPENVGPYSVSSPVNANLDHAWNVVEHYGDDDNALSPYQGESLLVLSTGWANVPSPTKTKNNIGGNAPDPFALGEIMYDAVQFTVELTAPSDVKGFSLDYIFMSVEYDEHVGDTYNDKFYMILNAPITTGGVDKVINTTECSTSAIGSGNFQPDFVDEDGQEWCFITVNSALSEPCDCTEDSDCLMNSCIEGKCNPAYTDISGTGFECGMGKPAILEGSSTGWLTTQWPISEGETFQLTLHLQDTGDYALDSNVLVDNFQWIGGVVVGGTASHN